jgi:hypothetical protein
MEITPSTLASKSLGLVRPCIPIRLFSNKP